MGALTFHDKIDPRKPCSRIRHSGCHYCFRRQTTHPRIGIIPFKWKNLCQIEAWPWCCNDLRGISSNEGRPESSQKVRNQSRSDRNHSFSAGTILIRSESSRVDGKHSRTVGKTPLKSERLSRRPAFDRAKYPSYSAGNSFPTRSKEGAKRCFQVLFVAEFALPDYKNIPPGLAERSNFVGITLDILCKLLRPELGIIVELKALGKHRSPQAPQRLRIVGVAVTHPPAAIPKRTANGPATQANLAYRDPRSTKRVGVHWKRSPSTNGVGTPESNMLRNEDRIHSTRPELSRFLSMVGHALWDRFRASFVWPLVFPVPAESGAP